MGLFRKTCRSKLVVGNFEKFWDFSGNNYFLFYDFCRNPVLGYFGKFWEMKYYGIVQPPSTDICCNHSLLPSFICNKIRILRFTYQAIFLTVM